MTTNGTIRSVGCPLVFRPEHQTITTSYDSLAESVSEGIYQITREMREVRHRLYSAGQIAIATIMGGPIGGCWMLGRNASALGQTTVAVLMPVLGVVLICVELAIGVAVVIDRPATDVGPLGTMLGVGTLILISTLTSKLQGEALSDHREAGGLQGSWWIVVGVGLGSAVATVVLVTLVALSLY